MPRPVGQSPERRPGCEFPANHRVDVHMEVGVACEQFQLLVQDLQALLPILRPDSRLSILICK